MILLKNRDRNPSFKKGEYVEINDAGNYPMEISVDGVCKQETTSGKNLLDYITNLIYSGNGLTSVINEDGSITTTGKPTSNYSTIIKIIDITDILEDGQTYTISQGNASDKVYIQVGFKAVDGTYTRITSARGSKSFEVNKTIYTNYSIMLQTNTISTWGDSSLTITNKYMLCKGTDTADTSFEPYTGGQPSPSPDYPRNISVLTGNLKLTSCGKNLFDKYNLKSGSYSTTTGQWVAYGSRYCTKEMIKVKPNTNYIINNNNKSSYNIKNIVDCYDINKKYIGRISKMNGDDNEKSYVVPQNGMYFNITFNEISDTITKTIYEEYLENGIISPQLEQSNQATPYEPYQDSSLNITIPSNEFVGKIGDIKDTLNVVYKEDGQYHLILNKMIGKVVLDGSSGSFTYNRGINSITYNDINDNLIDVATITTISNYFVGCSFNDRGNLTTPRCYFESHYLHFRGGEWTNTNSFKTWLSTHNTIVYYVLATPYQVDLGIVDTLLSYDNITNIFTDSDLYPVINAKYYKDFKFDKILRSGYNIDEQEYEIAKKQMANGKRKRILSSYVDCIIKINLGLLDNKTYQEYKEHLDDGEFHYWSYKYNQYKKANFILTKPSITTEYAYDDDIGINDMEITLEKSSDIE